MSHRVLTPVPPGPPPTVLFIEDVFTATLGQTIFNLSQQAIAGGLNFVAINGVTYDEGVDYAFTAGVGSKGQWLNVDFSLEAGDEMIVRYQK